MKKIIVASDSFKGTLSSSDICGIIEETVHKYFSDCEVRKIPMADGGEGTVDAFLTAVGGRRVHKTVSGPLFEPVDAFYGILPDNTAVIEMAAASGLPLVYGNKNAAGTTSLGTGELIADAVAHRCRKIILGLGGSACTDGGMGIVSALGVKFLDSDGKEVRPNGKGMRYVHSIDVSGFDSKCKNTEITVLCDVRNPLAGKNGAAYVFGPQKGADDETVKMLDSGLLNLNSVIEKYSNIDRRNIPGMGAAGGSCLCLDTFLSVKMRPGIDFILDMAKYDDELNDADFVITGEGKMDYQSAEGKVPVGVARRASKKNVPVIAIVGDIGEGALDLYDEGITAVFSTNKAAVPFSIAKKTSREDYGILIDALMRFILSVPCRK